MMPPDGPRLELKSSRALERPGKFARWVFRLPLLLYKLGFPGYERLFGQRWMLLLTKGRHTGQPHAVLLDVVGHDPKTNRYYIQPGWGRHCDWVLNVQAYPFAAVQVDKKRFRARVVDVSGVEGAEQIFSFAQKHWFQALWVTWLMPALRPPKGSETQVKEWYAKNLLVFGLDPVEIDGKEVA
jgi:deazaflavin-dependent oxidoreductase (nitroreductase family)